MAEDNIYLLTQDAYDQMRKELEHRQGPLREEIVQKISAARAEGDLSENGGYHAAREAQAKNEGRINELIVKLRDSKIITPPEAGTVGNGTLVTLKIGSMEGKYLVGSHDLSIATSEQIISPQSPIGQAVMDHHTGDTVTYTAPTGREIQATIVDAQPYKAQQSQ